MKRIKVITCLLFLCLLINSCTKKTQSSKITLNIWIMPNSTEPQITFEKILEDFKKENPDINLVVTVIDWGSAWSKITTAATSGTGPDICQLGTTWVGAITSMGALLDLTDLVKNDLGVEKFVPNVLPTAGIAGSFTSVPWIIDARALFYRKDIFDKLGISTKDMDTWEGFERVLKKIYDAYVVSDEQGNLYVGEKAKKLEKEKGYFRVYPIGVPGKNDWNVIYNFDPWIWSAGGDWITPDNKPFEDPKEILEGIKFYTTIAKKYTTKSALELNSSQIETWFANGRFAIIPSGAWTVRNLSLPPEKGGFGNLPAATKFGVVHYPKGPKDRCTFLGGSNLAIFKSCKNPELAWKVIKYIVSKKPQIEYAKNSGFLPATVEAYDDPYFDKNPHLRIFKETVKYARPHPCIPLWGPAEVILIRRLGTIWDYVSGVYGEVDIEKRIKEEVLNIKKDLITLFEQNKNQK